LPSDCSAPFQVNLFTTEAIMADRLGIVSHASIGTQAAIASWPLVTAPITLWMPGTAIYRQRIDTGASLTRCRERHPMR
jgi:hypothetical protein